VRPSIEVWISCIPYTIAKEVAPRVGLVLILLTRQNLLKQIARSAKQGFLELPLAILDQGSNPTKNSHVQKPDFKSLAFVHGTPGRTVIMRLRQNFAKAKLRKAAKLRPTIRAHYIWYPGAFGALLFQKPVFEKQGI
jgi:hypothetical protein